MSIFDNLKNDVTKDAEKAKEALGKVEEKAATPEGRKWVKYVAYGVVGLIVLGLGSCMLRGCGSSPKQASVMENYQPQQGVVQQPVVQQGGLTTGESLALGALGGYVIGKTLMPNGQVYQGTPEQRTYVTHYYQQNPSAIPAGTKPVAAPVAPTPAPVAKPLTPAEQKSLDQKAIKASADKAAEAEKAKMVAEQAEKDRQAKLKADLQAKQAARAATPAPAKPSGFNAFSKSASTPKPASAPSRPSYSAPSRSTSSSSFSSRRR